MCCNAYAFTQVPFSDLDLNVRDDLTGSTALEIAEAENNEEMVNTIERRMAQDKN